MAHQFVTGLYI